MKKLLIMAMAMVVALSATACSSAGGGEGGAAKDAYEIYTDMNTAMDGVKSVEMTMSANMAITAQGQTMDITMNGTTKEVIRSETDVDIEMIMSMNMMGQAVDTVAYYTGGYMYQDMSGMKYKTPLAIDEALAQANMMEGMDISKDAIKASEVTEVEGGQEISFTLDGSKMGDQMQGMMDGMLSSLGVGEVSMNLDDVSYTVVVDKDNMPVNMHMVYGMSMDVAGEQAEVSYDITMDMLSFNSFDSIDFPADLDTYEEMAA